MSCRVPPRIITLKLVSRGFVVKMLHLRGVALLLSKIITSSVVLFCPQQPHLSLCRSRAQETGAAGAGRVGGKRRELISYPWSHTVLTAHCSTHREDFFDSSVRAMHLLD